MKRSTFLGFRVAVAIGLVSGAWLSTSIAQGEPPVAVQKTARAIASGEFVVASRGVQQEEARQDVAERIDLAKRDQWLGQIAVAQSRLGESSAASSTLRQIESSSARRSTMDQASGVAAAGGHEVGGQGAGGGAFADFDSLMNLIETTVVPDTWEALGGNSTMAPYPQGVYVDPKGTVRVAAETLSRESLENLDVRLGLAERDGTQDWRSESPLRCVSLRRLRDEITERRMTGQPLGDSLLNLAGLSHIQYMVITDDDIVIAAPVGGIDLDRGWYLDRATGRTTLRSDFMARCFAATQSGTPFGCTIDPTPAGMKAAAEVASMIKGGNLPIGLGAKKLKDALGMQRVEVFGTAGDAAVALLMVEADRHMKQLALGEQEMPAGVDNYLDIVNEFIDQGPPDGLLLRLWFTANAQSVRSDGDQKVFEIAGNAIRLSGQNQRALAGGGRGAVTVDPRSERFVQVFNQNWNQIRDRYPVYAALESLYRVAAVSELVERFAVDPVHRELAQSLAMDDESRDWRLVAPTQVESIARLHTVRKGKKRHHVLMASGGVAVQTKASVKSTVSVYPTLASTGTIANKAPAAVDSWWWNAR